MALTVETGTGSATADTVVEIADVASFATSRGLSWPGSAGADTVLQEAAIRSAADYLKNEDRFRYRGTKVSAAQRMPFPRTGCTPKSSPALPSSGAESIPWQLKDAQCLLAIRAVAGVENSGVLVALESDRVVGAIKREKIDVIETEYVEGTAPTEKIISAVVGILAPLLKSSSVDTPSGLSAYLPDREAETPFSEGDFDFK
jgi:hypothetical protein